MSDTQHKIYKCFPGGKFKVLTMSYDDGRTFDRKLVEIFNRYGIRGTFHLNSGFLDDDRHVTRKEVRELYKGHEVSCHTVTHPTIARSPMTDVVRQILEDREQLEDLVGYPVRGLSYPNGSYSDEIVGMLKPLGIEYARTVHSTDTFAFPENFLKWDATCHHTHNLMEDGKKFVDLYKKQYLYLMYVWGHSFEFDNDDNWDLIENFCKLVSGKDDIWYATNIEIVDYQHLWDSLVFSARGNLVYNPSVKSAFASVDDKTVEIKGGKTTRLF